MRVLMCCGGTAGHINPALAMAETIKKHDARAEFLFVGTKRGKENTLVPAAGYELRHIRIQGIKRSLSPENLKTLWYVLTSPFEARKIIKEFKPDIVIGTGGYACWPALKAASEMHIPSAVHESNSVPGLAVKKLKNKVDKIFVNFEETAKALGTDKAIVTGNPAKNAFGTVTKDEARAALGLEKYAYVAVCFGGSLGSDAMNENGLEFMEECGKNRGDTFYLHGSGAGERYEKMKSRAYRADNVRLADYIYDMPLWMAAADVVISRAGAVTISELALTGKAAIIIPSPNVVDNHQYKNAKMLADADAAVMLEEKDLFGGRYSKEIKALLDDEKKRERLGKNILSFAKRDANEIIYSEILKLIGE